MHSTTFTVVTLIGFAGLLAGCSESPAANPSVSKIPQPAIADIATSYKSYQKITGQPVYVNAELAMLCRGAGQDEVEIARKTKGPHANTAILIYMNDTAARTFRSGKGSYEPGAVIVKEKMPGGHWDRVSGKRVRGANEGVGGMVKRPPGFDPAHGDWEYFYFEDTAKIDSGHIASCIKCHDASRATDYVFGTWASRKNF